MICSWKVVLLSLRRGCVFGESFSLLGGVMGLEMKSFGEDEELWSGGVHVTLDCPMEQAWALFADFGGLCKWNPAITVCDIVEGESDEPGSVRYCRGTLPDSWVYERLLVRDEKKHFCKYQMEENRFRFRDGVQGYVSQIQVSSQFPIPRLYLKIPNHITYESNSRFENCSDDLIMLLLP